MGINAGRLENCPRLQDVFWLLADGREHSTREISNACERFAINSIIDELRDNKKTDNNLDIRCKRHDGAFWYRMERDHQFYTWRQRLTEMAAEVV